MVFFRQSDRKYMQRLFSAKTQGFSLVEISIGVIIISILLAVIVAGQNLIHQAKIKNTLSETAGYKKSTATFREVYSAWPGDIPNATSFWSGTENGNDDQQIIGDSGGSNNNEGYRAWQHLSLSEMIKGNFDGLGRGGDEAIIGGNVPKAAVEGGGYFFHYWGLAANKNNAITIGTFNDGTFNSNPVLTPRDAEYIDRKIDDGSPRLGNVWAGGNGGAGECYTGTAYNLTEDDVECILHFWLDNN